jgi:hypothetical protein
VAANLNIARGAGDGNGSGIGLQPMGHALKAHATSFAAAPVGTWNDPRHATYAEDLIRNHRLEADATLFGLRRHVCAFKAVPPRLDRRTPKQGFNALRENKY